MGKYISKRKRKKVWQPMKTLPINETVWLVFSEEYAKTKNLCVLARTCNSWTGNMVVTMGGIMYNRDKFDGWAKLKKPINFH